MNIGQYHGASNACSVNPNSYFKLVEVKVITIIMLSSLQRRSCGYAVQPAKLVDSAPRFSLLSSVALNVFMQIQGENCNTRNTLS